MRTRIFTRAFLTLVLVLSCAVCARQVIAQDGPQARRVALVIGNGAYPSDPLPNPANDAADMAKALSKLGFEVRHGVNLTQRQMRTMIREFGQALSGGGQGLFYFAGHGMQLRGRNYLIPVDADIQNEADVEDQGVDANLVLGLMYEARNGSNVMILDACRNNPFAKKYRSLGQQRGLVRMDAPLGTLIAYATAPGATAADGNTRNGLYTQELLRHMHAADVPIEEVFKRVRISVLKLSRGQQTPWEESSLTGNFYFANAPPSTRPVFASEPAPAVATAPTLDRMQYYDRGRAHMVKGDYERAMVELNNAIAVSPVFAEAYALRGALYQEKKDHDRAIADATRSIELKFVNDVPYIVRGAAYAANKDYDRAMADFNRAIEINPKSGPAYYQRATIYGAREDFPKALADVSKSIALGSITPEAYYLRGIAYTGIKQYDNAISDMGKAIEVNPKYAMAYYMRAALHQEKGDAARAEADWKIYRQLSGIQ